MIQSLKVGRTGAASLLFGLLLVCGCTPDPYPDDLKYPPRKDLLVQAYTEKDIPAPEPLGQLDSFVAALKTKKGADTVDPADLPSEPRGELREALDEAFGTPARPAAEGVDEEVAAALKLEPEAMARGSVLYRRHCVHCHGLTGDGRGPTAPWVHPHPRDYRRGVFKFASTRAGLDPNSVAEPYGNRAGRDDLLRTLREGVEGTSMPNFRILADQELEDLVSYVIHLSLRGEVEFRVLAALSQQEKEDPSSSLDVARSFRTALRSAANNWGNAQKPDARITPKDYPYANASEEEVRLSVRRGFDVFRNAKEGACLGCHTDYGRNAGFLYDAWGTLTRPVNLTTGVYRGGRRPVDIYYRIQGGILASNMPTANTDVTGNPQKIWDLVNFVKALPYPAMLPDDVRDQVYGPGRR